MLVRITQLDLEAIFNVVGDFVYVNIRLHRLVIPLRFGQLRPSDPYILFRVLFPGSRRDRPSDKDNDSLRLRTSDWDKSVCEYGVNALLVFQI